MAAGIVSLLETRWYRSVTLMGLTWLAAAGPMPPIDMTPVPPLAAVSAWRSDALGEG
ncbi:hypothetical protein QTI17_01580 [Variovorax sp. J31P179]|uniref:hypothetical protein n=1 Tax=Variovorax sp. J31P179 TaxID=3053508 RepID=UPI002577B977|nr:hypothetical protein [Variovorax sp. J31P179]MDM0079272.1 hypothetical protein [Variovorax sp. J31P179]